MTNIEKLRKMSVEELAKLLCRHIGNAAPICQMCCGDECEAGCDEDCTAAIKAYFEREAEK